MDAVHVIWSRVPELQTLDHFAPMTARPTLVPVRIIVALILEMLIVAFGLAEMAKPATNSSIVWRHIWPSVSAVASIVVIWPLLLRGGSRLQVAGALLVILPCLVLFYIIANHFDLSTPLDRWFYGLG